MRHNKKRNAVIIYEQLVRFISKSLVDGDVSQAKVAVGIVREHFRPGTHLYKEFRLFHALARTTVESENIALRIIDEAKKAAREHDAPSLDREKGLLIRSINKDLRCENFFEQRIPDYRSLATIQTLLNDWRSRTPDIARVVEYEEKVTKILTERKVVSEIEKNSRVSTLSVDIMKKKVGEKISREISLDEFKMIKMSISDDSENLIPVLFETKNNALSSVNDLKRSTKSEIILEKISLVKNEIDMLNENDTSSENVSRFLILNKMIEEINGENDVK